MNNILVIVFSFLSLVANAQDMVLSAGAEKTVNGNEFAGSLMYETKKSWALGTFYQTGLDRNNGEHVLVNPFYGLVMQAPVMRSDRISLFGVLRTGVVNNTFFIVVPAVETRVLVTSRAGFSIGAGLRAGHPSFSAKLFTKLF